MLCVHDFWSTTFFCRLYVFFFFFNDTATTEIYTLSLHDALKIAPRERPVACSSRTTVAPSYPWCANTVRAPSRIWRRRASRCSSETFGTLATLQNRTDVLYYRRAPEPLAPDAADRRARVDEWHGDDLPRAAVVRARDDGLCVADERSARGGVAAGRDLRHPERRARRS